MAEPLKAEREEVRSRMEVEYQKLESAKKEHRENVDLTKRMQDRALKRAKRAGKVVRRYRTVLETIHEQISEIVATDQVNPDLPDILQLIEEIVKLDPEEE